MTTLFIDTHLWDIVIILLKDGKVVNKAEVINKKNNSEYIFPTITKVIDNETLDEIVVVNGPGSFTGVRLGVTIAKTLAYTLNIPIKVIDALKVMAISNVSSKVAIDDNNGYYVGEFDDNYNSLKEYTYIKKEEDTKLGEDFDINYTIDIEKVYEYLKNVDSVNPHGVNPIYIKKIGVEIDKESKK